MFNLRVKRMTSDCFPHLSYLLNRGRRVSYKVYLAEYTTVCVSFSQGLTLPPSSPKMPDLTLPAGPLYQYLLKQAFPCR